MSGLNYNGTESSERIDAALQRGAVMLTPHGRLARSESAACDANRNSEGATLWQPATILPWRAWTATLWRDAQVAGVESRVLLNDLQERSLWETVITASGAETLQSAPSLARLCVSAAALLGAYDLRNDFKRQTEAELAPDAETFARWWTRFESLCSDMQFLPAAFADLALAEHIRSRRIRPAAEYLLHGFTTFTPAQQQLLDALAAAGADVRHVTTSNRSAAPPTLIICASAEDERTQCAAWARHALEHEGSRIAIVVPDLEACRPALERALRNAIAPEFADVTATNADAPYEFSTGRHLRALPMAAAALQLLRWCAGEIPVDDAAAILRSPFLTLAATPERGAEIEAAILHNRPALRGLASISTVARWIDPLDPAAAINLRELAAAARNLRGANDGSETYATFADGVRALLRSAGWPGPAPGSEEHQLTDRWDEMLDRLASLDALGRRITFATFFDSLYTAADDTTFAPENRDVPLQVTTVHEAIGRPVDALWFLHADERTWPPRQRPHPLLPRSLQANLGMPGTDTARDEATARQRLALLAGSATTATFSCAPAGGETAQHPSPLVLELNPQAQTSEPAPEPETTPALEQVEDTTPLPPLPQGIFQGGVSMLATQALCGFRAFAEKRLYSRPLETAEAGLTDGVRGEQVHGVLEAFWSQAKDQQGLATLTADRDANGISERDRLLRACINTVVPAARDSETWEAAYLDVQRERLFRLLTTWLDFELNRPPFQVQALEQVIEAAEVGPLHLKMRLDRIDRIGETNEAFLIDYKTGTTPYSKADWLGDRPNEPQLPVYAIAGGIPNVHGIAFAAVKVGKNGSRFEAAADDPSAISAQNRSIDFNYQLDEWKSTLVQLATNFAEGRAQVAPKEYPKTCARCSQRMLCRLDADLLLDFDDTDEEEEEGVAW